MIMGDDFLAYIERLQIMAFFAGYPLIYALVQVLAGRQACKSGSFANRLVQSLPYAYALTATLFLGMLLRDLYPDYSMKNISGQFQDPWLRVFGLLAMLNWIPFISQKPLLSLLHSLVFFFFIIQDLLLHITTSSIGKEVIQNDMRIFTDSFLLNTVTVTVILAFSLIIARIRKR